MQNQKGNVHFYTIAGIALVCVISYGLINKHRMGSGGTSADKFHGVLYEQTQEGNESQTGYAGNPKLNQMLYDIADAQEKLLRMKVECIAASWPHLSKDAQFKILRAFRADTEKQQAALRGVVNRLNMLEGNQFKKRNQYLAELARSISDEQGEIINLIDGYVDAAAMGQ
jgi:hypothetical protein